MCEWYDAWWKLLLAIAFALSVLFLLLRTGALTLGRGRPMPPHSLVYYRLVGMGLVGVIILLLLAFGLLCANSPGDYPAVVPE